MQKDDALSAACDELLARNELQDARLRLTVTRGRSERPTLHGLRLEPTTILTAAALDAYPEEYYQRGMTAIVLDEQKLNPYDLTAGHKTSNYLSRFAALREATRRGAARRSGSRPQFPPERVGHERAAGEGRRAAHPADERGAARRAGEGATIYPKSNVLRA